MAVNLMTLDEVARLAKVSEKTIRREIACGALQAAKLRRCWRVREADFEEWVERCLSRPDASPALKPTVPEAGSLASLREIEREAA